MNSNERIIIVCSFKNPDITKLGSKVQMVISFQGYVLNVTTNLTSVMTEVVYTLSIIVAVGSTSLCLFGETVSSWWLDVTIFSVLESNLKNKAHLFKASTYITPLSRTEKKTKKKQGNSYGLLHVLGNLPLLILSFLTQTVNFCFYLGMSQIKVDCSNVNCFGGHRGESTTT